MACTILALRHSFLQVIVAKLPYLACFPGTKIKLDDLLEWNLHKNFDLLGTYLQMFDFISFLIIKVIEIITNFSKIFECIYRFRSLRILLISICSYSSRFRLGTIGGLTLQSLPKKLFWSETFSVSWFFDRVCPKDKRLVSGQSRPWGLSASCQMLFCGMFHNIKQSK